MRAPISLFFAPPSYACGGRYQPRVPRSRAPILLASMPAMQFAPHLCSQFPTMRYRGLGALTGQTATIASAAAAGAASTASILVALGTIGGPVGAAIAGLAALGLQLANVFAGCGQTCTEASNLANQAEAILTPMFNTYMASPIIMLRCNKRSSPPSIPPGQRSNKLARILRLDRPGQIVFHSGRPVAANGK